MGIHVVDVDVARFVVSVAALVVVDADVACVVVTAVLLYLRLRLLLLRRRTTDCRINTSTKVIHRFLSWDATNVSAPTSTLMERSSPFMDRCIVGNTDNAGSTVEN